MKNRVYFLCFSPHQLINALYYGMKVQWGDECETVLIWTDYNRVRIDVSFAEQIFDRVVVLESLEYANFFKRQLIRFRYSGQLFHHTELGRVCAEKAGKHLLFCFLDMEFYTGRLIREFAKMPSSEIVLAEEGAGTYMMEGGPIHLRTKIMMAFWGQPMGPYVGSNENIRTLMVKEPDEMPAQKTKSRTLIRQRNVFADRELVAWLKERFLGGLRPDPRTRPKLLWIGEPLNGLFLSKKDEMRILGEIFAAMSRKYQICVKAHPKERQDRYARIIEKYGAIQLNVEEYAWLPVEVIAQFVGAEVIMTPLSSAAYNIYECGVQAKYIYCYKLFGISVEEDYFENHADKANIFVVETFDELMEAVDAPVERMEPVEDAVCDDVAYLERFAQTK